MAKRDADPAIVRSIHVLGSILGDLVEIAVEAEAIARKGDQNASISLLERIEPRLQAAASLHGGILALHRQR
jgi:hypothetical protein